MVANGNEAYVSELIEGVRKKIGFYDRKINNFHNLVNICKNK